MRVRARWCALSAFMLTAAPIAAQQPAASATAPAPVMTIYREEVKVGKGPQHAANEERWASAFRRHKTTNFYLGTTTSSGAQEAWFFEPAPNYAAIESREKDIDRAPGLRAETQRYAAVDGDILSNARTLIAEFRPAMGSPSASGDVSRLRGMTMTTWRIRPGKGAEWSEIRTMLNAAYAKAGVDPKVVVYEVTQGANTPTYLAFRGFRSMAEMDLRPEEGSKMWATMSEEQRARFNKLIADVVMTRETTTLMINPRMSHVSEQTVAADPAFWAPKPVVAQRAAPAKP